MTIFYEKDTDYAEIFFKKEPNYGEAINDAVTVFKSEKSDKTVGYGFEDASRTLFESDVVASNVKLAVLLKMTRARLGLTQEQSADRVGTITFRHYQRLESGEENPTLKTVECLKAAFPETDFSLILKPTPKSQVA
jgi:DNA-binding XRE family transcriptional regulator